MEKKVGITALPGLLKEANCAKKSTCTKVTVNLISPGFLHTDRSGWIAGRLRLTLRGREKERCGHSGCKRRSLWKKEWASNPSFSIQRPHMGFLPSDCPAAIA